VGHGSIAERHKWRIKKKHKISNHSIKKTSIKKRKEDKVMSRIMSDEQYSIMCMENSDFVDYLVKSIKCQWQMDIINGKPIASIEHYKLDDTGKVKNERHFEFPLFSERYPKNLPIGKIMFNQSVIDFGEYDFGDQLKTIEF